MAIYDCFQYFNEEHIADLRFNILNEFVDYFVIVESTVNHQGKEKKLQAKGLLATCIQHEIDHLDGILFIDYLSKMKRDMIIKKLVKHKKTIDKIVI